MGKGKHHSRHRTRDDERSDSDSNDSGSESGNERDNRHSHHDRHKSSHHHHHHHHSRHRSSHHSRYNDGADSEKDRKRERSHSKTSEVDRKRVKTTTNPQTNTLQPTENSTNPTGESSSPNEPKQQQQQQQQQPQSEPVDPEIQKRRERVERWRKEQERLKKEAEERERKVKEAEASNTMVIENGSLSMSLNTFSSKAGKSTWTSGDSDDDDRSAATVPGMSKTRESNLKNMFTFTADNGNADNGTEDESEVDEFEEFFAGIKETAQRDVEESSKKIKEILAQSAATITSESSKKRNKDDDKNGHTVFWTDEVAESLDGFYDVSGDDDDDFTAGGGDVINIADYFPENRDKERRRKNLSILEIDHSAISYPQFRKDFYVEVPEIAQMDAAEVARVRREELDGCMVHGRSCPRPIRTWGQCGLSTKIVDTLQRTLHFDVPTAIQRQAIPALMSGRDVLGCAKTGSGKTLAYVLPMLRHVLAQDPLAPGDGPIALVMAPTRELVQQIAAEAMRVAGRAVGVTVAAIYGGADVAGQIAQLKRGAEIVVCTPGRMIDVLTSNGGRVTNLRRVTFVVLDEADRMFDMGFEPQVAKIVGAIRPDRQLAMFSATFPYAIEQAARKMLSSPLEIICGGRGVACKDIAQCVEILLSEDERFSRLLTILTDFCAEQTGQALVFVNRQAAADRLFQELLGAELSVLVLHGGVDQLDRESTIMDFKRGERRILIATSVAARGLDVKGLDLVVNYEPPSHIEDYVHRIGRTGRAGRKGTAITLLLDDENDERYAPDILKALKMSDQYVPPQLAEMAQRFGDRMAQAKLQGKSIAHGSGFGGKGYKFDEEERKRANELKKLQRSMHMGEDEEYDGFNESDAESDDDNDDNVDETSDSTVSKAAAIATATTTAMDANITSSSSSSTPTTVIMDSKEREGDNNEKGVEPALDPALMNVTAVNPPQLSHPSVANLSEDVQKALSWASRFNTAQRQLDAMQKAAVLQSHFEDEVEINDLPQNVRFQLTQRDTINQIQEYTGAAVTVRGRYIDAAAKRIDEDDRKLYLLIEATSREAVQLAKKEIKKAIEEATYSGTMSFSSTPGSTRYSVL